MNRLRIFFISVLLLVFEGMDPLQGAAIHSIMICDTCDPWIGFSVREDFYTMRAQVQKIGYFSSLPIKEYFLIDGEVKGTKIFRAINDLELEPEDIVIFYFSGHGYRTASKNAPFPNLYLSLERKGIDLHRVADLLSGKEPMLLVMIADCCNDVKPDRCAPQLVVRDLISLAKNSKVEKSYRKLFLESKGRIYMTSSKAGQYSWCGQKGGLFTQALIASLENEVKGGQPDWVRILENASVSVTKQTRKLSPQQPEYQIELK